MQTVNSAKSHILIHCDEYFETNNELEKHMYCLHRACIVCKINLDHLRIRMNIKWKFMGLNISEYNTTESEIPDFGEASYLLFLY